MSTIEKGNSLEDEFYDYLYDQVNHDQLVFGAVPASLCQIFKKKKYYCKEREADVEFDIVIEVRRKDKADPYMYIVFECKNHRNPLQEPLITDFSDKIGRIFGHSVKGVVVSSSRLQSGAQRIAKSRHLGIVKFDVNGVDFVAERKDRTWAEGGFLQAQMFDGNKRTKSLKFAGYSDGLVFGSVNQMLQSFEQGLREEVDLLSEPVVDSVAFLTEYEIRKAAQESLSLLGYVTGAVDVKKVCKVHGLNLTESLGLRTDSDGNRILGLANFGRRSIEIFAHGNVHREKFTIAHEVGHFCLDHARYLCSDSIIENDLLEGGQSDCTFNIDRLEYQANAFASELLLPYNNFKGRVDELRTHLGIYDRGFGYIFVDDQPCNYSVYSQLLSTLSDVYAVSQQAIEVRLKRLALLTDQRRSPFCTTMGALDRGGKH